MKVLLYTEFENLIHQSGLGKAVKHQMRALEENGVPYTRNPKDDYDIIHINWYGPRSYHLAKKAHRMGKKVVYHAHSTEEDFRNSFKFSNTIAPLFKKWICKCYRLGTFNLHASLLPQYRGAAPINWAVINGDKQTGVTTFFLKHEIDTGNIILQEKISIGDEENVGSVHDRLMTIGADLVCKTVDLIIESETSGCPIPTMPQVESSDLKPAPKIFKDTCRIDFSKTTDEVHNFVRGLSPYPAAWCNLQIAGKTIENVKVYAVKSSDGRSPLAQKTADGYVDILELQAPGKKRMAAKDFLNGLK